MNLILGANGETIKDETDKALDRVIFGLERDLYCQRIGPNLLGVTIFGPSGEVVSHRATEGFLPLGLSQWLPEGA